MALRSAHILAHSLRTGDAVGNHTMALARILRRHAEAVTIWVSHAAGALPDDIAPLVRQTDYAGYPGGADLTFLQYPLWFPLAEHFRRASGVRLFWYHGVTPPRLWPAAEQDFLRNGEVRSELAWYAHAVAAASPFIAGELHAHAGYPLDRIRIVPLGVDTQSFAAPPAPGQLDDLRRRWQVEHKRILLYVGRVAGNKRIDLAIRALAQLLPDHPDLHLLVVGDTQDGTITQELAASLQRLAQELAVAHAVTFTGRVPDVEPYFHLADLFVQPSEHEGFGVPLVEAMAAGLPVVASASGSLPWLLGAEDPDGSPAGLLFAPGDAGALAAQVRRWVEEPALAAELVRRGRDRAAGYSHAQFERAVEDLLRHAAATAAAAPAEIDLVEHSPLFVQADVALRIHRVRSGLPVVGRLVEWLRVSSMLHFKEAYLDRVVEQQVNFNRLTARHLLDLRRQVEALRQELDALNPGAGREE